MVKQNITIKQIAAESGVSIATVSRVINGNTPVNPKKRRIVEQVIAKYEFSPNAMARSLVNHQSMTLGIILPDITNPYFSAAFLEIERFALEAGYCIFLCNTLFGGSSHGISTGKTEEDYFQIMIDKRVDGVLVMGGQIDLTQISDSYRQALTRLRQHIPVVVIGEPIADTDCFFIQRESGSGVVCAVNYLHSLGHKRIGFVGGQPGVTITNLRLNAYKKAVAANGIAEDEELISLSDYYAKDGYDAMNRLLGRKTPFSAIVAINDTVALGAQRAIADAGMSVPDDIAMISCDRFSTPDYQVPRLTGIDRHNETFGRMVIATLISAIRGADEPTSLSFTPELIIRESCGTKLGARKFDYR